MPTPETYFFFLCFLCAPAAPPDGDPSRACAWAWSPPAPGWADSSAATLRTSPQTHINSMHTVPESQPQLRHQTKPTDMTILLPPACPPRERRKPQVKTLSFNAPDQPQELTASASMPTADEINKPR